MHFDNETDVREDLITPLLRLLGYEKGSSSDILREWPLKYEQHFLGRKKKTDPPIRGIADYVLSVLGAGRWILEAKGPREELDRNVVEQSLSYARHPEVQAIYAVLTNGSQLHLYRATSTFEEGPIATLRVEDPEQLAKMLEGTLAPEAIRRDMSFAEIDLEEPIATGLRSKANILVGEACYEEFDWSSNFALPLQQAAEMDQMVSSIRDSRQAITGGEISRNELGQLNFVVTWAFPNHQMFDWAQQQRLDQLTFLSLDRRISLDRNSPTVLDVVHPMEVKQGDQIYNQMKWQTEVAGIDMHAVLIGRASGFLEEDKIEGVFSTGIEFRFPALPQLEMYTTGGGVFSLRLEL